MSPLWILAPLWIAVAVLFGRSFLAWLQKRAETQRPLPSYQLTRFTVLEPDGGAWPLAREEDRISFGSTARSDVVLPRSRYHETGRPTSFTCVRDDDGIIITSRKPLLINGVGTRKHRLAPGDKIIFDDLRIIFEGVETVSPESPPAPAPTFAYHAIPLTALLVAAILFHEPIHIGTRDRAPEPRTDATTQSVLIESVTTRSMTFSPATAEKPDEALEQSESTEETSQETAPSPVKPMPAMPTMEPSVVDRGSVARSNVVNESRWTSGSRRTTQTGLSSTTATPEPTTPVSTDVDRASLAGEFVISESSWPPGSRQPVATAATSVDTPQESLQPADSAEEARAALIAYPVWAPGASARKTDQAPVPAPHPAPSPTSVADLGLIAGSRWPAGSRKSPTPTPVPIPSAPPTSAHEILVRAPMWPSGSRTMVSEPVYSVREQEQTESARRALVPTAPWPTGRASTTPPATAAAPPTSLSESDDAWEEEDLVPASVDDTAVAARTLVASSTWPAGAHEAEPEHAKPASEPTGSRPENQIDRIAFAQSTLVATSAWPSGSSGTPLPVEEPVASDDSVVASQEVTESVLEPESSEEDGTDSIPSHELASDSIAMEDRTMNGGYVEADPVHRYAIKPLTSYWPGEKPDSFDADMMFIHAHPDDEAIDFGALMAKMARAGKRIVTIIFTAGESGLDIYPDRFVDASYPAHDLDGEDLATVRRTELERSLEVLGSEQLIGLGLPNNPYAGLFDVLEVEEVIDQWGGAALIERLTALIAAYRPEFIVSPDGPTDDAIEHFEHEAVGVVVAEAIERLQDAGEAEFLEAHLVSVDPQFVENFPEAMHVNAAASDPESEMTFRAIQIAALKQHITQRDAAVIAVERLEDYPYEHYLKRSVETNVELALLFD